MNACSSALLGDELIHYVIGDVGFCRLNAIAYPRGCCDRHDKKFAMRSLKMRSKVDSVVGEDSRPAPISKLITPQILFYCRVWVWA
jgi:hypothetical protein